MDKYAQLASLFTPSASTGTSELDKLFGLRPITDEEIAAKKAERQARIEALLREEQGVEPSGASEIPALGGDTKAQMAWAKQYLESQGLPPHLAAGALGNVIAESGGRTSAVGDSGASVGAFQWQKERLHGGGGYTGLLPYAQSVGASPYDLKTQLDYFLHELKGPEQKALQQALNTKTPEEAAAAFAKYYERPAGSDYSKRMAYARQIAGGAPIQSPAGSPADQLLPTQPQIDPNKFDLVTLTDGSQAYFEKGMSPEEMMGKLAADGVNALPTRPFKTPSGESVLVQYDMSDDEALKTIGAQTPELVQRPRGLPAEEDKSGFLAAAKKGAISGTGTVALGLGDIGQYAAEKLGPESTIGKYAGEFGQAAHQYGEEAQKRAEEAFKMPEDASWLAKNIGYPFMETAGQALPYAAASVIPGGGLARAASMGTALLGGAYGQAEQKAKEVGKPFDFEEATPTALADATLNYFGQYVFGPLKGMFGPEAVQAPQAFVRGLIEKEGIEGAKAKMGSMVTDVLKNAGITGGAEIANEVAEDMLYRGYGDQDIFSPEALQSYIETAKQVAPFGVGMGGIHGVAQRSAKVEALTREEEQKTAAEAEAAQISREQEMRLAEDMKSARVNYEKLGIEAPDALSFQDRRQALDDYLASREAEKEALRAELPEDLQQLPLDEAQLLQKARGEQEKYYAPLGLPERGQNVAVKRHALEELDINNPEHAATIGKVLDEIEASKIPFNAEGMKVLRQRLGEVQYASGEQKSIQGDGGGQQRQEGIQEVGYPPVGGEGVRPSDQVGEEAAGEIREVKGPEIEVEGVQRPTTDSTGAPIHTTEEGIKNFWKGFEGTRAVDEQGRPKVMYHGTRGDIVSVKDPTKSAFDREGLGSHFTPDSKVATGFAESFGPEQGSVFPVYLNIKNPLRIKDTGESHSEAKEVARSFIKQGILPKDYVDDAFYDRLMDNVTGPNAGDVYKENNAKELSRIRDILEGNGYDGLVYDNEIEGGGDTYVPFRSTQIKSAIGNIGQFDTTKPDIREAGRYPDIGRLKLDISKFQDAKDSKTLLNRYMEHGSDEGLKTLANMFASSRHAPAIKVKFVTPETAPKLIAQRFKKGAGAVTAVDQQGATMYFRADKPETFSEDFILHENLHGMTIGALKRSPHMMNEFKRLNTAIGNALRDASSKAPNDAEAKNLSDFWDHVTKDAPDELLTYGLTSPTFRAIFKEYAADGRPLTATRTEAQKAKVRVRPDQPPSEGPTRPGELTLLQRFTDFIRKLFGISEKNKKAFEDALAQYEQRQADYEQHIKDYETIKPLHGYIHERLKTLLDITEREGTALPSGRQVISKAPGARRVGEEGAELTQPTPEEQKKLVEEAKKSGLTAVAKKGGLGSAIGSMMSDMANKGILLPFQTAVFDERAPIPHALNKLGANVGKKLRADSIWGAFSQRFNTIQQAINSGYTMMGPDGTLEAIENSQLAPQQIFDRVRKYGKQLGMSEGDAWKVVSEILVRLRAGTIRDQDAKTRQDAQNYLSAADELDAHASTRMTSDEKRKFKEAANKLRRQAQDKLDSIGDDGRTYVTQEEVEAGRKLYMAYKDTLSREVDNIHELLRKIPDKLEAAGMIDAKTAKQYRDYPFYFPFYDRAKFDEEVLDPLKEETLQRYLGGMGRGLKSVAEVKRQESHGHTIYTADNLLRHLMYWDSAVAEHGARAATCEQLEMTGGATRLMGEPSDKNFVVKVKRDGKDTYYKIHDPNVYYAFQASAPITGPIVNALRKMSRFQRGVAVFNPLFWYKQLIRDPKQVSRIGKVGMITPLDALGELTKIVAGKSKGYERIVAKGVVGPVDIGSNPHERIRALVQGKGFSSKVYHKLNEIHEAVDAATRSIVYNRALEKYKKWGIGDDVADALAIKDAREVMNFSRKGKNQHLNLLRSVTPFLGSYINSIDVLLKAMSPETYGKLSKADAMEMRRAFLGISSSIATLSLGYSLLMSDDEEWVNNADRNGNILIRNPFSNKKEKPFIMLPLEFEVGWLQHTLPENMMLANLGAIAPTTEKANLKESAAKALMPPMDFFSYARPLITAALQYEDSRAPGAEKKGYEGLKQFQDERATEFSKMLADELEKSGIQMFSPNDIDKYMNDFFGGYWSVAQSASSYMLAHRESGAVAPAKTMTEMLPWFGKAFSGEYRDVAVRDAFKVLDDVQQVQNTFSRIKATKDLSKYNEFVADPEFVKAVQADKALNGLSERMSKVSTKIATVIADENIKDPQEKRRIIDGLNQEREDIAKEVLKRAKAAGVFE